MKICIGFAACDDWGKGILEKAFEDILLDEIADKKIYESSGDDAVNEAYDDWEAGNTDAIVVVQPEGCRNMNPAQLRGMDMLLWEGLRMAFVTEGEDVEEQEAMLRETLRREFDIDNPRITDKVDEENLTVYDAILVKDCVAGMNEFMRLTENRGVAYTTGRELICTSPMNEQSLHECIYMAKDILAARKRWDDAHANPLPKLYVDKREDNRRQPKPFPPFNEEQ